ncbi:MAG: carbohydrate binding domain-containing protein, partial [Anaerolineae bacterium]
SCSTTWRWPTTAVVGWRPGLDPNPGSQGRGQLIVNPGFEQTHPYFSLPAWSPDDEVTAEATTATPRGGSRALKVTISGTHRVHQFVRVAPGSSYQFGGWLKSGNGAGRARVFVNQYNASTQPVAGAAFGALETAAPGWTYLTGTLTTSATTRFFKIELDGHQPGSYYFDDLWLEKVGETNHQQRDIAVPLAFYDWYVQKLTDYQNWQITELRKHYGGQLDIIYAGKGLLANQITDALTNDLRGDGWSEATSALYSAAVYNRHVAQLPAAEPLALYLTGIDEPAANLVDDAGPYPSDWSAARWIAHLAANRGIPAWAENSGQDDTAKMQLSVQRVYANNYAGLMWAFESELYADPNPNGYATIADYEALIALYSNLQYIYLPLIVVK